MVGYVWTSHRTPWTNYETYRCGCHSNIVAVQHAQLPMDRYRYVYACHIMWHRILAPSLTAAQSMFGVYHVIVLFMYVCCVYVVGMSNRAHAISVHFVRRSNVVARPNETKWAAELLMMFTRMLVGWTVRCKSPLQQFIFFSAFLPYRYGGYSHSANCCYVCGIYLRIYREYGRSCVISYTFI